MSFALISLLIVRFIPLVLLLGSMLILGLVAFIVASPVLVSLVRLFGHCFAVFDIAASDSVVSYLVDTDFVTDSVT